MPRVDTNFAFREFIFRALDRCSGSEETQAFHQNWNVYAGVSKSFETFRKVSKIDDNPTPAITREKGQSDFETDKSTGGFETIFESTIESHFTEDNFA